ncbi:N-alpha-acetyl diaminobutyric acid deacetylase DoeB [Pandoraea capi]|uniref:N-alpha-acetyl diaminobutyric acid deacetylase DoeB n=1 Tax=Pandoraea capi TaxID=2508286 RepID=A0ABY6WDD8_9BURK|nr:N(2)-acetyl-L-2,4-diaminobutanoate deacetylase DoeB [Pandoraea capi]VVE53458.1 N-alpha-acetyl diaminobutyric acid deacetylase DoeB [Pandoraea capi]
MRRDPAALPLPSAHDAPALPPRVYPTVDFQRDGIQHGFLKVPHSNDASAWGAVMVPITVIRRGNGPVALLTGGNHGDEYEGPIVLSRLANTLKTRDVSGTVIIVPFMNAPAVQAGKRTSPLDGGNLNRAFPGRPDGTVTERIADYFSRCLLPMADVVLDIHSGGRTLDFVPFAAIHELDDAEQQARCDAAMRAFGAPYALRMRDPDSHGLYDNAAEAQGKVFVTTELGGGGTASARNVAIAHRGVYGVLVQAGIVPPDVAWRDGAEPSDAHASVQLTMPDDDCYVASEHDGLLEMLHDLGTTVRRCDVVARIHDITRTGTPPVEYRAKRDGMLIGRHFPGRIGIGDTLCVLADVPSGVPLDA